jgi:hypothetical protein
VGSGILSSYLMNFSLAFALKECYLFPNPY